jgi:hypothetical protein
MKLDSLKDERLIAVISLVTGLFLYLNMDSNIGTFFTLGCLTYSIFVFSKNRNWFVDFSKNLSVWKALGIGIIGLAIIVAISYPIIQSKFGSESLLSYFSLMKEKSSLPLASDNIWVKYFVWGVFIPLAETFLFLSLVYKLWGNMAGISGKFNFTVLWVIGLVGVSASAFHWAVRNIAGVASEYALGLDVIFFSASAFIVWKYGELLPAFFTHAINNIMELRG